MRKTRDGWTRPRTNSATVERCLHFPNSDDIVVTNDTKTGDSGALKPRNRNDFRWCRRGDLNPHAPKGTSPSS